MGVSNDMPLKVLGSEAGASKPGKMTAAARTMAKAALRPCLCVLVSASRTRVKTEDMETTGLSLKSGQQNERRGTCKCETRNLPEQVEHELRRRTRPRCLCINGAAYRSH